MFWRFRGFQRFQKFRKFRNIRNIQNIRKLSIKKGAVYANLPHEPQHSLT